MKIRFHIAGFNSDELQARSGMYNVYPPVEEVEKFAKNFPADYYKIEKIFIKE